MKFKIGSLLILLLIAINSFAWQSPQKPKLVVGIVVDQMRHEYLYRFSDKFGADGFMRLMNDGFVMKNAHYNYIPTKTAPGHASIYTGGTPSIHGIIANEWYDKTTEKKTYCVTDNDEHTIGSNTILGQVSPKRLVTSTITDELRLSNQMRSKVISISVKDRGATLPGGHSANAAYWFDKESGDFITSSYYMDKLPGWVEKFNKQKFADKYLRSVWKTKLPIETYTESGPDNYSPEGKLMDEAQPTFPHDLSKLSLSTSEKYNVLKYTPFTNTMTTDMVLSALETEKLGQGAYTDFLAISYSATDYVGHKFGPNSVELEDTFIRLDEEIASLLKALDRKLGKDNYIVFLTSDHAVADIPQYLIDNKMPAGLFNSNILCDELNEFLSLKYGKGAWIKSCLNMQVYFNWELIRNKKIDRIEFNEDVSNFILSKEGVARVYSAETLKNGDYEATAIKGALIRGFHHQRSGDIAFVLNPGWYDNIWGDNADHGSGYSYDTHVPMIFYGWRIKKGSSTRYHPITDIAPTLSILLKIKFPNGCTGQPIQELLE